MPGKKWWAVVALLFLSLTSGCRVCERWYERNHDPYENDRRGRPNYAAPGGYCPPGCAPAAPAPACPPGCAPAPYGAGYGYGGGGYYPVQGGCP